MIPSPLTPAQAAAQNMVNQINNFANNLGNMIANGVPARDATPNSPAVPAVSASELNGALGAAALSIIDTLKAAMAQPDTAKQAAAQAALQ